MNKRRTNFFLILNYNEKEAYLLPRRIYFGKKEKSSFLNSKKTLFLHGLIVINLNSKENGLRN